MNNAEKAFITALALMAAILVTFGFVAVEQSPLTTTLAWLAATVLTVVACEVAKTGRWKAKLVRKNKEEVTK